jgi:hypothetical protein
MTAGSSPKRPVRGSSLRSRTALAVLVLMFGPTIGRVPQRLGRDMLARHQVTFSHSGVRPPNRVTVSAPIDLVTSQSALVLTPTLEAFAPLTHEDAVVSLFDLLPDALRGPPLAIL